MPPSLIQRNSRYAIKGELVFFKIICCVDNPLLGCALFDSSAERINFRRNLRLVLVLDLAIEFLCGGQCSLGRFEASLASHNLKVGCANSEDHDVAGILCAQER